jgi:hypothetical protein
MIDFLSVWNPNVPANQHLPFVEFEGITMYNAAFGTFDDECCDIPPSVTAFPRDPFVFSKPPTERTSELSALSEPPLTGLSVLYQLIPRTSDWS